MAASFFEFNATAWQNFVNQIKTAAVVDGVVTQNSRHLNYYVNTSGNHYNIVHSNNHSNSGADYHYDSGHDNHSDSGYDNHSDRGYDNHSNSGYDNHTNSGGDYHSDVPGGNLDEHYDGAGYDQHTEMDKGHRDSGYDNHSDRGSDNHRDSGSDNHRDSGGDYHYDSGSDDHSNSGYDNHTNSGYSKAHQNIGYLEQYGVNYTEVAHTNTAPSTPKSFAADGAMVKRNIKLGFYSYDPDTAESGVYYNIQIRKIKDLQGNAQVSDWVTLQNWSTAQTLDLNTVDLLGTGNTSLADSQGTYEIQVQARNNIPVQHSNGNVTVHGSSVPLRSETKYNYSKILTTHIVVNQALQPTVESTNYATYFKYYFGRNSARQAIGYSYSNYTDVSKALLVNMTIQDYNMAPVSGNITLKSEDGSKYVTVPIYFKSNNTTSRVSDGTKQEAYAMFSASQLISTFEGYDLTRAKFEVVVNSAAPDGTKTTNIVTSFTDSVDPEQGNFGWVNLDLKLPTVEVIESGNVWRQSQPVQVNVTDNGSGLTDVSVLHCVNGVWTTLASESGLAGAKTWSRTYPLTVSPQIRIVAVDGAGNTTTKDVNVKLMDPYKPTTPSLAQFIYSGKFGEPNAKATVQISNLMDKIPSSSFKTFIQDTTGKKTELTYGKENMSFTDGYETAVVATNTFTLKPGMNYTVWQEDLAGNVSARVPFGYPDPNGLIIPGNAKIHTNFEVTSETAETGTQVAYSMYSGNSETTGKINVTQQAGDNTQIVGTDALGYPRRFVVTNFADKAGSFEKNVNTRVFSITYVNDGGTRTLATLGSYAVLMRGDTVSVEFNGVQLWSQSGMPAGSPNTIMLRLHTNGTTENEILMNGVLQRFSSQVDSSPAYGINFEQFGSMYVSNVAICEIGNADNYSLSILKPAAASNVLSINDFEIDLSGMRVGTSKEFNIPSQYVPQLPNHVSLKDGVDILVSNSGGAVTVSLKPEMDQMISMMKQQSTLGSSGSVNANAVSLRLQELIQVISNSSQFEIDERAMHGAATTSYNLLSEADIKVGTDGVLDNGLVRVNGEILTNEEFAAKLSNKEIKLRTPQDVMAQVRKNLVTQLNDEITKQIDAQAELQSSAPSESASIPKIEIEVETQNADIDLF